MVAFFFDSYEGEQKKLMLYLHRLLTEDFNLTAKIRFNIPFYYFKSWICYLSPVKNGKTTFAFIRGNELSNEQGLLESKGRKQVLSIDIATIKDIPAALINEIIPEAILLDETIPYASKRKK